MPSTLSVQFSLSAVSDSLQPHGLQHARPPCSSSAPRVYSHSCPWSRWCHPAISSSVIRFSSSCLQSFPASGSFQMNQFFTSGGQSIGISASTSVLPMNIQDRWYHKGSSGPKWPESKVSLLCLPTVWPCELLNLCVPQFPRLDYDDHNNTYRLIMKLNALIWEVLRTCLAQRKDSGDASNYCYSMIYHLLCESMKAKE